RRRRSILLGGIGGLGLVFVILVAGIVEAVIADGGRRWRRQSRAGMAIRNGRTRIGRPATPPLVGGMHSGSLDRPGGGGGIFPRGRRHRHGRDFNRRRIGG